MPDDDVIDILLVEDNTSDAHQVRKTLDGAESPRFEVDHRTRLEDGIDRLDKDLPDAVLLDLGLPDSQGLETLQTLHGRFPDVPVVVLTGLRDEDVAIDAVTGGAYGYIVKDHLDTFHLVYTIRSSLERHRTAKELEQAVQELVGDPGTAGALTRGVVEEVRAATTLITNGIVQVRQEAEGGDPPPGSGPRISDAVQAVQDGVDRVDRLMDVLARFVGAPGGSVSLHEPVVTAVLLFRSLDRGGVGVDADLHPTDPVDIDAAQLQHGVLALLRAAADRLDAGGMIQVTTRAGEEEAVLAVHVVDDRGDPIDVDLADLDRDEDLASLVDAARIVPGKADASTAIRIALPLR